jgi:hypothetical protein
MIAQNGANAQSQTDSVYARHWLRRALSEDTIEPPDKGRLEESARSAGVH